MTVKGKAGRQTQACEEDSNLKSFNEHVHPHSIQ